MHRRRGCILALYNPSTLQTNLSEQKQRAAIIYLLDTYVRYSSNEYRVTSAPFAFGVIHRNLMYLLRYRSVITHTSHKPRKTASSGQQAKVLLFRFPRIRGTKKKETKKERRRHMSECRMSYACNIPSLEIHPHRGQRAHWRCDQCCDGFCWCAKRTPAKRIVCLAYQQHTEYVRHTHTHTHKRWLRCQSHCVRSTRVRVPV